MTWHFTFRDRVEKLGQEIEDFRQGALRHDGAMPPDEAQELATIEARHADLNHTVRNLQIRAQAPRGEVIDGLEADFEDLMQAIGRWIDRQDSKAISSDTAQLARDGEVVDTKLR